VRPGCCLRSRVVVSILGAMALIGLLAPPAHAHFLGNDSVDGSEIRYQDNTQWNDALNHAIGSWEGLTGGVNIAPDAWNTVNDLDIGDYTNTSDGRCGFWQPRTGEDYLRLNGRYFNPYSTSDRRACMTHEWGHAHGLAHSYTDQVMDACPSSWCNSPAPTTPQDHDRADYYYLW
jgi:hypothetical protein